MANTSFLDFQYNLSKRKFLKTPSRLFSFRDRQGSGLKLGLQPTSAEMRKVFDRFDFNKDGKISQQEYKILLKALGKGNLVGEVSKIFKAVDLDRDGFINFKEFVQAHEKEGGIKTMEVQSAFTEFDLNGDGKISAGEVQEVLRRLGEGCSSQECQEMVRAVDSDGDGMVNMDEFMTMMTRSVERG